MFRQVVFVVLFAIVHAVPAPAPTGTSKCETGRKKDVFAFNSGGPSVPMIGFGAENPKYLVLDDAGSAVYKTTANITTSPTCTLGKLYQSERFTRGAKLVYRVPMPKGKYVVTTFHAETFFDSAGKRLFHIEINGARMRSNLDVFADANGMNKGIKLHHHNIHSINGSVEIAFVKSKQNPQVNAIRFQGPGADKLATGCCGAMCGGHGSTDNGPTSTEMGAGLQKSDPSLTMIPVITDPSPSPSAAIMMTKTQPMEPASMSPEPSVESVQPTAIPVTVDPSPSSAPSLIIQVPAPTPEAMVTTTATPTQMATSSSNASMISTESVRVTPPPPSTTNDIIMSGSSPAATTTPKKASGSGCKIGEYIFCEDFDSASKTGAWTLENAAKVALAPVRNGKRSKALYLNPAGGQNGRLNVDLKGADGPILHGRVQLYVKEFATGPPFAHFVVAELSEAGTYGTERVRPVGGQYVLNGTEKASVWGVGSDAGPTGDWTQWRSSAPTEDMRWTCVQWRMQRSNSKIDVWIDGKLKPELTVDREQHTGGHGKFEFPKFNKAWFGWWVFQGDTTPSTFDVYIDDIALSTKPIGC